MEVFARNGFIVVGIEVSSEAVDKGEVALRYSTDRALSSGKLTDQTQAELPNRVRFITDLAEYGLVVEALPEHLDLKCDILRRLDQIVWPDAIWATNTSSLLVTEISVATEHPSRVVGMHFFNPAQVQQFVEVVRSVVTQCSVVQDVKVLAERLGKIPVVVGDKAGFIANALLSAYLNDAVKMLEAHYASADEIDTAMKTGCSHPMGPFELLDAVGLDVSLAIQRELYLEFSERGFSPAPLLEQLVGARYLGRKVSRGFRTYV